MIPRNPGDLWRPGPCVLFQLNNLNGKWWIKRDYVHAEDHDNFDDDEYDTDSDEERSGTSIYSNENGDELSDVSDEDEDNEDDNENHSE